MHIVNASINENEDVYLVSAQEPVLTFDMGYVTLISPEGEELTLHGYIDVEKCDDIFFYMIRDLNNSIRTVTHKKKNKLTENAKREIYYDVMKQMSRIVKEKLDML